MTSLATRCGHKWAEGGGEGGEGEEEGRGGGRWCHCTDKGSWRSLTRDVLAAMAPTPRKGSTSEDGTAKAGARRAMSGVNRRKKEAVMSGWTTTQVFLGGAVMAVLAFLVRQCCE